MRPWLFALAALALPNLAAAEERESFRTPSGNIVCAYSDEGNGASLRCDIRQMSNRPPPRPADCDTDWGDAFEVAAGARQAERICHGDAVAARPSRVLAYGETWRRSGFSCHSAPVGLTCRNDLGAGFELSRASQRLF